MDGLNPFEALSICLIHWWLCEDGILLSTVPFRWYAMSHSSSQSLPPHPHQSNRSTIPIELLRGGLNRFAHPLVTLRSRIPLMLEMGEPRGRSRTHLTSKALLCITLLISISFCGSSAEAITLGDGPKISPQNDVRRFVGSGPTTGIYKDSNSKNLKRL